MLLKKVILTAAATFCFGAVCFATPDAGDKVTVIVEIKGDTALTERDYSAKASEDIENEIKLAQADVMSEIKNTVSSASDVGYVYTHVLNGFSMELSEDDIERVKELDEVENVYISKTHEPFSSYSASDGGKMINAQYMFDTGYTGENTVIAVIDDGFDTSHEMFGNTVSGENLSRQDITNALNSGTLNADNVGDAAYKSKKIPFAYNYNKMTADTLNATSSHGTHVAGIAAGNNGTAPDGSKFTGVAPDAQVLMMACPLLTSDAIIAAMDDAVKLGADVINASFGAVYYEQDEAEEKAVMTVLDAGVHFCCAAGNSSRGYNLGNVKTENTDYGTTGTPNVYNASTSVANVSSVGSWQKYRTMTAGGSATDFSNENETADFSEAFSGGEYEYEYVSLGYESDYQNKDLTNKIALVDRGVLTFEDKAKNAKKAGAVGMVIINNVDMLNIGISKDVLQGLPVAAVMPDDGERMKNADNKILRCDSFEEKSKRIILNMAMDNQSSWGVSSDLRLKPEISAPGSYIYSSVNGGGYDNKSGTSMAAPQISGASALLRQYINEKIPAEIIGNKAIFTENLLMTCADVMMQDDEKQIPYSPRQQGAGIANLEKAVKTPVVLLGDSFSDGEYRKSKVSLGEIDTSTFDIDITAVNFTGKSVEYDDIRIDVITDEANDDGIIAGMKRLGASYTKPQTVLVGGESETDFSVSVSLDNAELESQLEQFKNGFYIDGFVYLSASDNSAPDISIPFSGYYGGWENPPSIDKKAFDGDSLTNETYMRSVITWSEDGYQNKIIGRKRAGTNIFVSESDAEYNEYASEDYAGCSPNHDGECDTLTARVMPLRRLGRTDFEILDLEGNVLTKKIDIETAPDGYYYSPKFTPTYLSFDTSTIYALPDGDYTFRVKTGFYGQKDYMQNEVLDMRFYIDRVKPTVNRMSSREENGRTYLDVDAVDNRYVMGIILSGKRNGESFKEVYPVKAKKEKTHTFDITGADLSSIKVEVLDYALNVQERTNTGLDLYNVEYGDENTVFTIVNTQNKQQSAAVIAAYYNKGKLVNTDIKQNVSIKTGEEQLKFAAPSQDADEVRLYIWDMITGLKPLSSVFTSYR